jgi:2-haloacid dehalogenase
MTSESDLRLSVAGIRAVAFDCYGTLIDFATPEFIRTMAEIARAQGIEVDPEALWDGFVEAAKVVRGENTRRPAYRRYDEAWALQFERAARELRFQGDGRLAAAHLKERLSAAEAYQEVPAVLDALRPRYRLVVLSNADDDFLHGCLRRNRLEFEAVVSSEQALALKPDPAIFEHLAGALSLDLGQILYVGDNPMPDIVGARRAGVPVAWLNRDGRPLPEGMPAPDVEIASLTELAAILK